MQVAMIVDHGDRGLRWQTELSSQDHSGPPPRTLAMERCLVGGWAAVKLFHSNILVILSMRVFFFPSALLIFQKRLVAHRYMT